MIKELTNVVAIEADYITVTSQVKSTCSSCAQVDTCGSGQVAKALPQGKLTLSLPYSGDIKHASGKTLKLGDCVVLALPEQDILTSAGQVYLFPLLGLFSCSALGQWLLSQQVLNHELFALGLGIAGAYLGYRVAKYQQQYGTQSAKLQPKIIEIIPSENNTEISITSHSK
ncbi:SoxR reducing system RseC family protein [Colwellia sp. E2M01]|uniref:SoxR reducing system RseC family protein n=1 Tax=Colwellia sp. E2M01 TaxID=2841561 RepID=UPI001C08216A|nr:SoxR reducing system RseC family protein [Colwellia sp. E2M01]MBU2869615.1 SoxR reducing system RseC family protein [Colwellia sp. E2M01]